MVHRREVDGEAVVFGNQGDLYLNAMTWFDHTTGSIWSQPFGEAIAGPLAGRTLELLPSTMTTWSAWRAAHPDTVALLAPGSTSGFRFERLAIVVELGDEQIAFKVADLEGAGVANAEVLGVPIAVVLDPAGTQNWSVFHRGVGDRTVELEIVDGRLLDVGTGSEFDPVRGLGRSGPFESETLGLLPGFTSFPADYERLFPDGAIWSPDQ